MLFAGVMARLNWDFTKLATSKFTETEYSISQNFRDVTVLADTEKITLLPSQDGKTKVVCYEQDNIVHTVTVTDGSLLSEKLFLAQTNTGSVKVPKTSAGGHCEIATGTGDIKITIEN